MAAAAAQHPWDDLSAQLSGSEVVDLGDGAQMLLGDVGETDGTVDGSVVDQDVDGAVGAFDPVDQVGDLLGIGQVGNVGRSAELAGDRLQGVLGTRHQRDDATGGAEGVGEGLPDAP